MNVPLGSHHRGHGDGGDNSGPLRATERSYDEAPPETGTMVPPKGGQGIGSGGGGSAADHSNQNINLHQQQQQHQKRHITVAAADGAAAVAQHPQQHWHQHPSRPPQTPTAPGKTAESAPSVRETDGRKGGQAETRPHFCATRGFWAPMAATFRANRISTHGAGGEGLGWAQITLHGHLPHAPPSHVNRLRNTTLCVVDHKYCGHTGWRCSCCGCWCWCCCGRGLILRAVGRKCIRMRRRRCSRRPRCTKHNWRRKRAQWRRCVHVWVWMWVGGSEWVGVLVCVCPRACVRSCFCLVLKACVRDPGDPPSALICSCVLPQIGGTQCVNNMPKGLGILYTRDLLIGTWNYYYLPLDHGVHVVTCAMSAD